LFPLVGEISSSVGAKLSNEGIVVNVAEGTRVKGLKGSRVEETKGPREKEI